MHIMYVCLHILVYVSLYFHKQSYTTRFTNTSVCNNTCTRTDIYIYTRFLNTYIQIHKHVYYIQEYHYLYTSILLFIYKNTSIFMQNSYIKKGICIFGKIICKFEDMVSI